MQNWRLIPPDGPSDARQQAVAMAERYGLQLSAGELDELVWLIEEMGTAEADAECAKSRARLVRENQLDTLESC